MPGRDGANLRVDHFFAFFEARLRFIEGSCLDTIEGMILMCVYLDSLAGYRYRGIGNKKRFRDFLISYGNHHENWQKLSLWLISKDIKAGRLQTPDGLLEVINRQIGSIFNYYQLNFNPDVDIRTLEELSDGFMENPWPDSLRYKLEQYDYASILWRNYRNLAIHEAALDPEAAPHFSDDDENVPYYRHMNKFNVKQHRLESEDVWFRIPARFVLESLRESIVNFRKYSEEHGLIA